MPPPPSPLLLPHQPAAAAAAMNLDHHPGQPPSRRRDDGEHLHLLLPSPDDLIPLHQSLITPDLALAFDIPAPSPPPAAAALPEPSPDEQARTLKRPRLVWTPQLHKRFVDAVLHLGIKNAVPKTIMQLMSVDGLTRENVASHLQKYRLYLKRMQGMPHGAPPAPADALTDQLFATVPVPPRFLIRDHLAPFLQVGNLPRHHHHHIHPPYYHHPQQQVGSPRAGSLEFGFARHHHQQGGERRALPLFPNST